MALYNYDPRNVKKEELEDAVHEILDNRPTSPPIPSAVVTESQESLPDDQRTLCIPVTDIAVKPRNAAELQNRRIVYTNVGTAPVTLLGQIISARPDGQIFWNNPTIPPGGAVDLLSQFIVGIGTTPAPSDLRINGKPAPAGTKGQWI